MIINYKKEKGLTYSLKMTNGFTLIETLVAISILMIAIASPINLAQKALLSAVSSRDQMTASFLAQDGLEAIKNLRDEIAIRSNSTDWLSPFSNTGNTCICTGNQCNLDIAGATYCNIDTTKDDLTGSIIGSSNPSSNPLKTGTIFTRYDLNSNISSKFSRKINIMQTSNPNEAIVQVRVCWPETCSQKIDIKDFIYNYSPNLL